MGVNVLHHAAERRFEAIVDGTRCVLEYRLHDEVMSIDHTEVPAAVGGRGIAGDLVRAAFETARRSGWRVLPNCSYAAAWVERHPEFRDLVMTG
jgi:predicted GNAT family acetyltransferase